MVDGVTTYYLYNTGEQVIEERDSDNALQARYTYGSGIDEPLTMERGGSVYYYHRDGLGSVTEISDASGALVERYEYDVYGASKIFDSSDNQLTASPSAIRTCLPASVTTTKAATTTTAPASIPLTSVAFCKQIH